MSFVGDERRSQQQRQPLRELLLGPAPLVEEPGDQVGGDQPVEQVGRGLGRPTRRETSQGRLADKAVTGFTSAINRHGGNETTLLALYNTAYHWGAVIVPPGYTDASIGEAGRRPCHGRW